MFNRTFTCCHAQDYTRLSLPKDAIVRLGKGSITGNVQYSPNGKFLAVVSSIGVWIYDAQAYQEHSLLARNTDDVGSLAFTSDGKTLASRSLDKTIHLWEVATSRHIQMLTGHKYGVNSIFFSPDGKTLASDGSNNTICLWNVETGKLKKTLTGYRSVVSSVSFSSDGKTIAGGSWDKTIHLWNVNTDRHLQTLTGPDSSVRSTVFSFHSVRMEKRSRVDVGIIQSTYGMLKQANTYKRSLGMGIKSVVYHLVQMGAHLQVEAGMVQSFFGILHPLPTPLTKQNKVD